MKFIAISLLVVSIQSASYGSSKVELQGKCTNTDECDTGLQCDTLLKQCKRSLNQGCTWNKECADVLQCLNKKCSKPLTVDDNYGIAKVGEKCDPKAPGEEMSCEKGVICDVKQGNVCKKVLGQSCEANKDQCFSDLECLKGRCSKKPEGSKCGKSSECEVGLVCKDSGSGKCCAKPGY